MNERYSASISKVLKIAEQEMKELRHPYVGTEHLLLSLLKCDEIKDITNKYDLNYESFRNTLLEVVGRSNLVSNVILYTPLLRIVLSETFDENKDATLKDLFSNLLKLEDGVAIRILNIMEIDIDLIIDELKSSTTNELTKLGDVLNVKKFNKLISRDKEINQIIEILLRKNKNNPLLIGEAGVGKSAIVYELAKRITDGKVPSKLRGYKIISLDMASLFSNTKYRGELETRLNEIMNELKNNKNIILFIDEIHTIMTSSGEAGVDVANALKPYLATNEIKVIGATTLSEYEKYILKDKALVRRFANVVISEPNREETTKILLGVKDEYEKFYNIKLSENNINKIMDYSDKYMKYNKNPDKSLELLDSICSKVSLKNDIYNYELKSDDCVKRGDFKNALDYKKLASKKLHITDEDIKMTVEESANIKILNKNVLNKLRRIDNLNKNNLNKIISYFNEKIDNGKTLGIVFRGNGYKREVANQIGNILDYNIIDIDMSKYSSPTSINQIIGSDPGYVGYGDECLVDQVRNHPYSLLMLNNADSACEDVINLFKSIVKNSKIVNKKNELIDFSNSVIIMISDVNSNKIGYGVSEYSDLLDKVVIIEKESRLIKNKRHVLVN